MDSAGNNNFGSSPSTPASRAALSGSAVAHEAAVIATGARSEASGKRELFKESTTTALVFPNGGVIRLSAAAAPGQLLFLTNPQNRREIVAQVTRRRSNPGSGYYIELEFTEPAPDFWGVAFPENAVADATPSAPKTQPAEPVIAPAAAEFLQPAEPGSDDLSPNAPAPSASEVQALVEEIEALRAQLKSMQTQNTNAGVRGLPAMQLPAAQVQEQSATALPAPSPAAAPDLAAMLSTLVASSAPPQASPGGDAHTPSPAPISSVAQDKLAPHRDPHPADSDDVLLPKPALDFQKAKVPPPNAAAHAPVAPPSDRTGMLRLALLAVLSLFAVMVAAWNMHLLPWLGPKSNSPVSAATAQPSIKGPMPARPGTAPKPGANVTSAASTTGTSSASSDKSATPPPPSADSASAPSISAGNSVAPADPKRHSARNVESAAAPFTPVSKRSAVNDSKPGDDNSTSPSADDGSITPPRLIKSVRAVAPGDALRQFRTGNVTLDAFIDKTGVVKSMKVLSGPPSFHKAAMEALRQYRYEPARQNGKPVSAHITVTVPFWFEP